MNSALKLLGMRARQVLAAGAQDDVPSPCQSVCRMDPDTGWCEGCLRTLDEIAAWSRLGDEDRRGVWREIALRLDTKH